MFNAIKFISLTYDSSNTKTYVKVDAIVQLQEGENATYVYIVNDDVPIVVKESINEILAKMGAVAWNAAG
jgi:hypothetical protein